VTRSWHCAEYALGGETRRVASHGVQAFVIDFTNSRLSKGECCVEWRQTGARLSDGITIYTDLASDAALFGGAGDIQFEVNRQMRLLNECALRGRARRRDAALLTGTTGSASARAATCCGWTTCWPSWPAPGTARGGWRGATSWRSPPSPPVSCATTWRAAATSSIAPISSRSLPDLTWHPRRTFHVFYQFSLFDCLSKDSFLPNQCGKFELF